MAKSNEVQVTITAKDEASKDLKKIAGMVDQLSLSTKVGTDFLRGMGVSLSDFASPAELAGKAVGFLVDTVKQGVADFAAYGEQVGDVSRKLGITAEESSKLIQVADDLEVDYSTLTQAMKEGLKDGIVPSIDGIADLATEYQALKTPAERAAFATDKFGRAGLEMQKFLEMAPDQLREMGDAISYSGLLMDEEGVKAAKEYRLAVDGLQDSWDSMVARTMPGIVKGLTAVNNAITGNVVFYDLLAEAQERGIKLDYKRMGNTLQLAESTETLTEKLKKYDDEMKLSVLAQESFREGERSTTPFVEDHTEAEIRLAETLDRRATSTDEVTEATEQATAAGIALYNQDMLASEAMKNYTAELLFNKVAANLDADAALSLATQMGLVDEKTVIATERLNAITAAFDTNKDGVVTANEDLKGYLATVAALNAQVLALPEDSYITIHVRTEGMDAVAALANITNSQGQVLAEARAGGGPVQPGGKYVVGENGPESLIMGAAGGQVYPTTNNYNLTINSQARSEQVQASFAMMRALAR